MLTAMKTLNGKASRAALAVASRCATDITGFGLLGHASHIARASDVTLVVDRAVVPILPGAREAAAAGLVTDGAKRNADYLHEMVGWISGDELDRALFFDPQTSGGLLVCVSSARVADYLSRVDGAEIIGEVILRGDVAIEVR
jgi:selenide,water dikinase